MRYQLLIGFVAIIAVVLGTSWLLALRTTDTQFALLISDANQSQARLLAPALLEEYAKTGTWSAVQEILAQHIRDQGSLQEVEPAIFEALPTLREGVISFSLAAPNEENGELRYAPGAFDIQWSLELAERQRGIPLPEPLRILIEQRRNENMRPHSDTVFMMRPIATNERPSTFFISPPGIGWAASNLLLTSQRALVFDASSMVVVDTEGDLLGKRINESLASKGVPLYINGEKVGTLIITPQQGIYSLEQNLFLQEVRQGFLISALISGGIALVLASAIAYQITRPIRSLTTAATRLQAGEWGYQVDFARKNELGQLAEAFNALSRHLAEQRHLRRRLVDDLAHELNTPLSLMRLEVQGMADGLQAPSEAAEHLNHELSEVTDLVADLVFLANDDSTPPIQMDLFDLNEVVRACMRRFEVSLKPGQELVLQAAENLPPLHGDEYLIGRALGNLLSNAIRHAPKETPILIQTRQEQTRQEDNGYLEVSIQDQGEGIPAEHLAHIFDRFYRVDGSRTRGSGGRGLGLAIVRQIMEQHGGAVSAHSTPHKGSTFILRFSNRASPHQLE